MSDGISIRQARLDDAPAILAIYGPIVDQTAISFEEVRPSIEEMRGRIVRSSLWLVAERDAEVLGYAYAAQFHPRAAYRWSTEISVYLGPDARGRGLGKRIVSSALDRLREMGFVNAFAGTTLPNAASSGLFESLGFRKIAHWDRAGFKAGAWHDVGWWQLRIQEPSVPPPSLSP